MELETELEINLSRFARVELCKGPSPVQVLNNLRSQWGLGFELSIKRDDLIGPAFGGNKSRQLEFYWAMQLVMMLTASFTEEHCSQTTAAKSQLLAQ